MTDLINIGLSGLNAYRSALSAVSDNITNANTVGYSRRTVNLQEGPSVSGDSLLYKAQTTFSGVQTDGVTRAYDQFKANDARLAAADGGQSDAKLAWLSQIETNLDDSAAGVGKSVTAVFNAGAALAADPTNTQLRVAFLSSVDGAASAFRTTATSLTQTATDLATQGQTTLDQINADLVALSKTNVELGRTGTNTSAHAQMEDQRDQLLSDLSAKIGVSVSLAPNGAATVSLGGSSNVTLLQGVTTNLLGLDQSSDGRLTIIASTSSGQQSITATSGALAGLTDVAGQLADRRAQLDQLANTFSGQLNNWSAQGIDQNGAAGGNLLTPNSGAAALQSLVTDPTKVAVASTSTTNGNALALANLRGANSVEAQWSAMVTSNAQIVSSTKAENSVIAARLDAANTALDSVTGVSLDNEAADLMRYQQAYSAAAQVIKAARDTVQTILEIM